MSREDNKGCIAHHITALATTQEDSGCESCPFLKCLEEAGRDGPYRFYRWQQIQLLRKADITRDMMVSILNVSRSTIDRALDREDWAEYAGEHARWLVEVPKSKGEGS